MAKIFDRLFYIGPLGLGDNFANVGLVHYFADRCLELHVPVWPKFFETMSCLYQDTANIIVVGLGHYDEGENQYVAEHRLSRILPTDLYRMNIGDIPSAVLWDMQTYANYEVPYEYKYKNFRLPKKIQGAEELFKQLTNNEPYILVHRRSFRYHDGFPINIDDFRKAHNLPNINVVEIKEGITDNMMQFVPLIERAEEIHVVASSFHCLVDCMYNKTKGKLFFHDIRSDAIMRINSAENNNCWTIVKYETKL